MLILAAIGVLQGIGSTARLAPLVREPVAFAIRQVRRRNDVGLYRLRESGVAVNLRHGTPDLNTLEEIFRMGHYAIPEPVEAALARVQGPLNVLDLGANVGLFDAFILGRYEGARIVSFEPHPENVALLEQTIEANALGDRWRLVRAAAAAEDGTVQFAGDFNTGRVGDGSGNGFSVAAVDVFPYLAEADLAKIDIEGGEWAILGDPRARELDPIVVALEYHPHLAPGDPRSSAHESLRSAGYETADHPLHGPPGYGMIWAWKT